MKRSLFPTSVVTKAFTWAYQELGLNIKQASEILGISPSSLAQTTLLGFESGTTEYRKQLAFIRMYHLLISLSDGDSEQMKVWFRSYNVSFEMSPTTFARLNNLHKTEKAHLLLSNFHIKSAKPEQVLPFTNPISRQFIGP